MVSSGDSSTTQPYVEDECEQLMDTAGYSTPEKADAANVISVVSHELSPSNKTPSPLPPRRPNVHTNAAAEDWRDRFAPSTSRAHGDPLASGASWKDGHVQNKDCFDDPLSEGKGNAAWTHASRNGRRADLLYSELAGSPSFPTSDGNSAPTTPLRTHWAGTGGRTTSGTNDERSETQQTRKRNASRHLFPDSNPEKTRRMSACGVDQNVLERTSSAVNFVRPPDDVPSGEISRLHGKIVGQPRANMPTVTGNVQWRHIFGEKQVIRCPVFSECLRALGSLDFMTAFQVLENLKGRTLEESVTVDDMERLKTVPKADVQTYLLRLDGLRAGRNPETQERKSCPANPRFECCVNDTGRLEFKISEQKEKLTALQRCFGPDKVLRVFFANNRDCRKVFTNIVKEGIFVGLRHYQYWTYKDTEKDFDRKKKPVDLKFWSPIHCYFVCTSSWALSDKEDPNHREFSTICEARCFMMHIHKTANILKYISRLQLALSDTEPVDLDFSTIDVKVAEDIHCKDEATGLETICTDGTGFISVDLAKEIAVCLKSRMKDPENSETQEYPSLIQMRLFYKGSANKGTLLAHNTLGPRTIVLRKSMQKVVPDPALSDFQSFNSLEICGWRITSKEQLKGTQVIGFMCGAVDVIGSNCMECGSQPPRDARLSRDLILLLTRGGVPGSFFLDLVDEAIQKVHCVLNDAGAAWRAIRGQDSEIAVMAQRMLLAGIPPKEPHLQRTLMQLRKDLLQDFSKGKVTLPDSCNLYGAADPSGTLKPNQVAITMGHGLVFWPKVAVYKSPGKHPGDIHIFEALANKELQDVVGSGKYVIFFSTQGSRSVTDEIANSDLDGDMYLITWNPKLLADYKEDLTRWRRNVEQSMGHRQTMPRPEDLPCEVLRDKLIEKYFDTLFGSSQHLGITANWLLAHYDQYLYLRESNRDKSEDHLQQAMTLIDPFYDLLDSEKTGIQVHIPTRLKPDENPHFLETGSRSEESSRGSPLMKDKNVGFGIRVNLGTDMKYHSTTILGQIYDMATHAEGRWRLQSNDEIEFEQAFRYTEINGFTGREFHDLCTKWRDLFTSYNVKMRLHMEAATPDTKSAGSDAIFLKYRRLLYGADTFDKSRADLDTMFANASAIYWVVYEAARRTQRESHGGNQDLHLSFAWKVAGGALRRMYEKHSRQYGEEQLIVAPRTFETFFGKSHSRYITEDDSPPSSP